MSQSDSVKVTVGDHVYDCFKLDPWTMNEVTHKILNTLGPTLGELMLALLAGSGDATAEDLKAQAKVVASDPKGNLGSFLEGNLNPQHLGNAIKEAMQRLSANETRWLMEKLSEQTTLEGGGRLSAEFSAHFLGRPVEMYRWAIAALRSQYSFLG